MQLIDGVPVWGDPDAGAVEQIKRVAETAESVALMADHHLGYSMPIGGVAAYDGAVSPSGVGFDIACGNKAVLTDLVAEDVLPRMSQIMDAIWDTVSFGVGRKNAEKVEHALFDDDPAWSLPPVAPLKDMARGQLGTVGSGNHYVDVLLDEQDRVWVGVHFGSRGLGHKIATHYLKAAGGQDGIHAAPTVLQAGSDLGEQYLLGMNLAGRYAYAGRDWVCSRVTSLLGGEVLNEVHNHHNFAWLEEHGGRNLWVVRKGATPAWPGQRGFIGGSMGDLSVIVEGVEAGDGSNELASWSTVHGAGRVMSRSAAAGKVRRRWLWSCCNRECPTTVPAGVANRAKDGSLPKCPTCGGKLRKRETEEVVRAGAITREMQRAWLDEQAVRQGVPIELRGAGVDESPHCYKRLPSVLAEHEGTIRVLHWLRPVGVAMAGADEYDPFKD